MVRFCPVIEFIVSKFVPVDGTLVKISVSHTDPPPSPNLQIDQSPPQTEILAGGEKTEETLPGLSGLRTGSPV